MVTFLTDDTGDILIDPQGNLIELSGNGEIYQRITNLFSTQTGTELFLEDYGFDKINFARQNLYSKEVAFNYFVMDALNPRNLFGIDSVDNIITRTEETTINGRKVSVGYITMTINIGEENSELTVKIGA